MNPVVQAHISILGNMQNVQKPMMTSVKKNPRITKRLHLPKFLRPFTPSMHHIHSINGTRPAPYSKFAVLRRFCTAILQKTSGTAQ
jgi:hypothetical protein